MVANESAAAAARPESGVDFATAHARLLQDKSLQFDFPAVAGPKPPPDWLLALGRFLKEAAPVLKYVFWGMLAVGAALILWFLARELIRLRMPERRGAVHLAGAEPLWRPSEAQARALLEDVDRLAADGRFDEAVHLLLFRSIQDIQERRAHLVKPALTSRDIAGLQGLPEQARAVFGQIAQVVERSFFGGRPVDQASFAACRSAYEAFALPEAWA
jgi:hypothetical protein